MTIERSDPPIRLLPAPLKEAMAAIEYQGVEDAKELSDIVAACLADFIAADNPIRRRETALALDNARAALNEKARENRRTLIKKVSG